MRTLVFAVATLDLLVCRLLHIPFEDTSTCWLIETSGFQNMCRIDPIVVPPSHNMLFQIVSKLEFIYRYLPLTVSATRPTGLDADDAIAAAKQSVWNIATKK